MFIAAKGLFLCGENGKGDVSIEGIFEALLQIIFEIIFEIGGEVVGEILSSVVEYIILPDSANFLSSKLPITASLSDEIITLDILNQNKETFRK